MASVVWGVKHLVTFRTMFSLLGWLRNPETPHIARLLAGGAFLYVLLPLDVVPDLVPILGWADDMTIFAALLTAATLFVPNHVRNPRPVIATVPKVG